MHRHVQPKQVLSYGTFIIRKSHFIRDIYISSKTIKKIKGMIKIMGCGYWRLGQGGTHRVSVALVMWAKRWLHGYIFYFLILHYVLHVSNTRDYNKNVKDYIKYDIKHPYYAAVEKNDRTLCVLSQYKPLFPPWLLSLTSTVSFAFYLRGGIVSLPT